MRQLSVFKGYEPGEPNCRLYVKNLAKQVTEKVMASCRLWSVFVMWSVYLHIVLIFQQELKFIFGKFIHFSSETEKNM